MKPFTSNTLKAISLTVLIACSISCGNSSDDQSKKSDEKSTSIQSADENNTSKLEENNKDYHELGSMKFSYQGESIEINSFEKNRTDLLFSQNSMVLRSAGEGDRRIQITLMKPKVYENPEGEYKCGQSDAKQKFILAYYPDYSADILKTLTSTEGTLTVQKLDMETGEVELTIDTKIGEVQDIINKTGDVFKLTLDMDFEKIVLDPSLKQKLGVK